MGLALQELLRLPALSRARVLGGDLARQVSWVHVVDLPEPAPWVRPGQLVLTTGYAWPRDAGRLEAFARTLAEREPAGVALAVPQFFERFPPAALEVLAGKGVAVLELPWEIPFAQVTEEVLRRLLARQLEVGERVHLLHRALMQAVLGREELETLLERLSQLLGRPVRYADAPVGFSVPVPLGRERGGYLVLEGEADEVERQTLENAALVAGLIVAHQRALAEQEARLGYAFLDALLEGRQEALTWERARAFGLDLDERYRLGVLVLPLSLPLSERDFQERERVSQRVRDLLKRQGASALLSLSLNQVRFLLPERLDPQGFLRELSGAWPLYLSRPRRPGELRGALEEVERLFAFQEPGVYLYETHLVPRFLLGDEEAREELRAWLAALRPGELEALLAWVQGGFSHKRAARALGIHLNTLRYRLRRMEEKLSVSLQDPEDRFRLELAARILLLQNKKR
ncbi:PucR family transcriptional regulator [Thermus scotoductus]|uniref:Crp/Fnr family transcriptional regulator n=1 Tax=Thermus scotoductus TaxID=37636 RepID=A0A430UFJ5_THESC|nr:PucR family transcriptional regulator [Thermus scotoductus]RTG91758.1 Crp/Fnr family transcriptional regulator [Thermus scotoductus]RTG99708.1 Crp/Fnr family transcriptional regulator [Thermus scotoductus]RTH23362.1 Crp/Fnr family transcriptional regulator [Thermus scotoductus]RTH98519.1 Crp/Fnr family transcriptional regulator [Thermus scotoductus]RTI08070.1 Crp/Fnr family transcriptional regulator [Thermus scotoductus]